MDIETLAHIALIARHGAEWFRQVGTAADPGSALVTVSGAARWPGVYEIPMGARLDSVLAAAGADPRRTEAVLVGGYFGTWIPARLIADIALETASLSKVGAGFGCGVLAVLPAGACGLAEAARVTRWLADQNAGQCGPCLNGLPAIADAMDRLVVGGDRRGRAEKDLRRWLSLVKGRGACKHPDGQPASWRAACGLSTMMLASPGPPQDLGPRLAHAAAGGRRCSGHVRTGW